MGAIVPLLPSDLSKVAERHSAILASLIQLKTVNADRGAYDFFSAGDCKISHSSSLSNLGGFGRTCVQVNPKDKQRELLP
jgi:hypothetical protein